MNARCVSIFAANVLILVACGCRSALTPLPPKETRTYQSLLEWTRENGTPGAVLLVKTPTTNFIGSTVVYFGNSAQLDGLHPRRTLEFEHELEEGVFELAVEQTLRISAVKSAEENDGRKR